LAEQARISAVVVAYNGIDFIADCLKTVKADLDEYTSEIIVIDNHSTDGTREFIRENHPDIRLIQNDSNLGFARAMNQGIEAARYEFLWLLNQDIRVRRGCMKALLDCYHRLERPGMIGPRLVGFDGRLQKFCRRFPRYHHLLFELTGLAYLFPRSGFFNGWKMGDFDHTQSCQAEQPMGAAMLVSREVIDKIGNLDESFGIFFNDVDFCYRLHQAGDINYYCYEAVVEHYGGGSVSRHKPKMVWLSHYSMFKYYLKREKTRQGAPAIKIIRRSLPYLAGVGLMLVAVPRSLYHWVRKII
jgi:N-acetylglucosaminyl-diphospho-decaprenol L-rhamnosyltransferase